MVLKFYASESMLEIVTRLNINTDGIESNIGKVLENEFGIANDSKYNTPKTLEDCGKRIRYLIDGIQAMRKANRDKGL